MHRLTIKDGSVYLDDRKIECVTEYCVKNSAKDKITELNLKLIVSTAEVNIKSSCIKNTRTSSKNFSSKSGLKLHEECPSCWVKNNKPYNCGFDKCPGLKLHILEINQVK